MEKKKKITLAESIEQILLKHISDAGLKFGDRIPSEQQLAQQIGVGRSVIREGLSRLRAMNLLQGNKRGGNVLCHPNIFASLSLLSTYNLMTSEDYMSMVAIRILMELGASDFIYDNASVGDIVELRKIANSKFINEIEGDIAFHNRMFAICGNARIINFGSLLENAFKYNKNLWDVGVPQASPVMNHHLVLCDELEHGTSQSFRRALYLHFASYRYIFSMNNTPNQQ